MSASLATTSSNQFPSYKRAKRELQPHASVHNLSVDNDAKFSFMVAEYLRSHEALRALKCPKCWSSNCSALAILSVPHRKRFESLHGYRLICLSLTFPSTWPFTRVCLPACLVFRSLQASIEWALWLYLCQVCALGNISACSIHCFHSLQGMDEFR